ncbi:transglycosylase family protein [Candidatus Saccharibacteria bacterium]|nr:transglycosylase family protein [Candidatus Saccharibacteria bacterium]
MAAKTKSRIGKNKLTITKRNKFLLLGLVFVFVGVGVFIITQIYAAGTPVFNTNPDYWRSRIARCESGGNYQASNGTNFGAYQFDYGTWKGAVGPDLAAQYPDPRQAPPAVQDQAFNNTFARRGTQPWNASYRCWISGADVPASTNDNTLNPSSQIAAVSASSPPPNPFVVTSGSYNVVVNGRVTLNNEPVKGVTLNTCSGDRNVVTGDDGRFSFGIPVNNSFCLRVVAGAPEGATLARVNNVVEHAKAVSYEAQRAGVDCYHSVWCLLDPAYTWDRAYDGGYNFFYTK